MAAVRKLGPSAGAKGMRIDIQPHGGDEDAQESRIKNLFERLGNGDSLKVYALEGGKKAYCRTFEFTDDLEDRLEETLVEAGIGPGDFELQGFSSRKYIASARLTIHRSAVQQAAAQQQASQQQQQPSIKDLLEEFARREAALRQGFTAELANNNHWSTQMMKVQADANATNIRLIEALCGVKVQAAQAAAPSAPASPLGQLRETVSMMKELREAMPSERSDNRSMTERVLEQPLVHAADRLIDRFFKDPTPPAPSSPTPPGREAAPAASTPAAAPATAPVAKLPAGFKPISAQQFAARKTAAATGTATGATPAAPLTTEVRPATAPKAPAR